MGFLGAAGALAISTSAGTAQQGWRENGAPAPQQSNMASQGDFGVMQVSTTDPDALTASWAKPNPVFKVQSETVRNKPIIVFIIFRGCHADSSGNCNVTADFNTFDPNGKAYGSPSSAPVWVGRPPPPDKGLQLSQGGLGLNIEDKDPLGAYRVVVRVTDRVAGITLQTEQKFTVKGG